MKKRKMSVFGILFLLAGITTTFSVDTGSYFILSDISFNNNQILLNLNGEVKYNIFKISNPPRLVVDLTDVEQNVPADKKEVEVNDSVLKRIRVRQYQNEPTKIARIVLDLVKIVSYKAELEGTNILITLLAEEEQPAQPAEAAKVAESEQMKQEEQPAAIKEEAITVTKPVEKQKIAAKKPVAKPKTAPVPEPKKQVAAKKSAIKQAISSRVRDINLPKTMVTLEYQDADIRDVLQVMSLRSGINIICGQDVMGTITLSLKDVPFNQAFDTILALKGLSSIPIGENIVRVLTPSQLQQERQQALTFTRIFMLNYADAEEIKSELDAIKSLEQGRKGVISIDKRNNALIVTDSQEGLLDIEQLIRQLDLKPFQVTIEAKIVDVRLDDSTSLGVNWNYGSFNEAKAGAGVNASRSVDTVGNQKLTATLGDKGGYNIVEAQSVLPTGAVGGIFSFGYITNTQALVARLAALTTQGKSKILSSPRITTINNKEATIEITEKIPFKTITVTPTGVTQESWSSETAGIKLNVTPIISPDGWVTLKVLPEVSVPVPGAAGAAPAVRTRKTQATVMVRNQETIVIGGLISESDIREAQKIPLLGDLPILGALFRYKSNIKGKTELLIFITPRILEE